MPGPDDDQEILERFRHSDTRHYAFNILVEKYQSRMYYLIRRMILDHDDTHDVMQNSFIRIWNNIDSFRGDSNLFTWIYRIATNEALLFLKKKKRRNLFSLTSIENRMAERLATDPLFSGDQVQLLLQRAILTLTSQQRVVFNLKYFEGLKYDQISSILGLTTGALKAHYHYAVKKITLYIKNH